MEDWRHGQSHCRRWLRMLICRGARRWALCVIGSLASHRPFERFAGRSIVAALQAIAAESRRHDSRSRATRAIYVVWRAGDVLSAARGGRGDRGARARHSGNGRDHRRPADADLSGRRPACPARSAVPGAMGSGQGSLGAGAIVRLSAQRHRLARLARSAEASRAAERGCASIACESLSPATYGCGWLQQPRP